MANGCNQCARIDGLAQLIVAAGFQALFPVAGHGMRGERNDWRARASGGQATHRFIAVHHGHLHVHENDVMLAHP